MKQTIITILALVTGTIASSQELFVVTEPASNMPAKSAGVRVANYFAKVDTSNSTSFHMMPEVMFGISKKIMVHLAAITSNRKGGLDFEGVNLYAKYRFLSIDEVQKHFRMALFTRLSLNNTPVHMHELNLQGHNSGYEWGLIATQLLHKVALSASGAYVHVTDNGKNKFNYTGLNQAFNYSFSAGKLMLPAQYKDYSQTNVNLMVELLGQINLGDGRYYTDIVPSLQMIINSQSRLDIGWRKQLNGSLHRTSREQFLIKFEHTFFNVFK
jgi:hypothetical protein